jgi:adenosylhomocysteinase
MPVLASIRERFGAQRPLAGLTVAACLHVTAETAGLVTVLTAGGARVALCAANPLATQDGVAAALAELDGVEVFARHGEDLDTYAGHVADVLDRAPRITIDDGADLLVTLHAARPDLLEGLLGGTEETTSGLVRLRAMQADGRLLCPVLAVNEARAERVFNDHYGTAQSTLDGILRATNLLLAGRTVVVLGYGPTGRGIALRSRGAGAQVVVCEIDPIAGLDARMEGFEVMPSLQAATRGDIFITVTGAPAVLGRDHFERMKDGAVLANAGHFDVEIDLGALRELSGAAGRAVPAARRAPAAPPGLRPRRQPRRRRGPSGVGHGPVLRAAGAVGRAPRRRRGPASDRRAARARRHRPRGRAAQARLARRGDRRAQRRAARVPAALVARRLA